MSASKECEMAKYFRPKRKIRTVQELNSPPMSKVTVEVPKPLLERAQTFTGTGVTETIREALRGLASKQAQLEFRKLRGTFQFSIDLDELREDGELWPQSIPPR